MLGGTDQLRLVFGLLVLAITGRIILSALRGVRVSGRKNGGGVVLVIAATVLALGGCARIIANNSPYMLEPAQTAFFALS